MKATRAGQDMAHRQHERIPDSPASGVRPGGLLAFGVIVLALNLRPAVVAASPLLDTIRDGTGMSATAVGLLTTLPLLCFGLLAPFAPRLGRRFGMEPALLATMVAICAGTALRLVPSMAALLGGTVIVGAGIAVANVLLPGVIKRDFPHRVGLMTGLYSMSLFGGAALAAGITVPVEHAAHLDWRTTLAMWGLLGVFAVVIWVPQFRRHTRATAAEARGAAHPVRGLWRHPVAWLVTGYMGLQSLSYYAAAAWLPTILGNAGMAEGTAGWMLSFSSLLGIAGAFLSPVLASRGAAGAAGDARRHADGGRFRGAGRRPREWGLPLDGSARARPGRGDLAGDALHRGAGAGRPARRSTVQHGPVFRLSAGLGRAAGAGRPAPADRQLDGATGDADRAAGTAGVHRPRRRSRASRGPGRGPGPGDSGLTDRRRERLCGPARGQ